jgi:hypothetical protein
MTEPEEVRRMVTDPEGETATTTPRIVIEMFPVATVGAEGAGPAFGIGVATAAPRAGAVCREEDGGAVGAARAAGFVTTHPLPSVFREPLGRTAASLFGWPGTDGIVTCCSVAVGGSASAAEAAVTRPKTTEPKNAKPAASAVLMGRS